MSPGQIRARGWEYWQKIYTSGSQALLDEIRRGYPDMGEYSPFPSLTTSSLRCIPCLWSTDVFFRLPG